VTNAVTQKTGAPAQREAMIQSMTDNIFYVIEAYGVIGFMIGGLVVFLGSKRRAVS